MTMESPSQPSSNAFNRDLDVNTFRSQLMRRLRQVAVPDFHRQHERLIDLIAEVYIQVKALQKRSPTEDDLLQLEKELQALKGYAASHFAEEEAFMKKIGFKGLEGHILEHRRFVAGLEEKERLMKEESVSYAIDLLHLVVNWLFDHINRMDMQYSRFSQGESYEAKPVEVNKERPVSTPLSTRRSRNESGDAARRRLEGSLRDVGVARFNTEHKKLLGGMLELQELVSQLTRTPPTQEHWRKIDNLLEFLVKYAQDHFRGEEALLMKHRYPDLARHKRDHERYINKVKALSKQLKEERQVSFTVDLNFFLVEWFLTHTCRVDLQYKEFFNGKGVR
ncbi:bacteriohemerythrin [Magnetococcales bacterium HHB-1]